MVYIQYKYGLAAVGKIETCIADHNTNRLLAIAHVIVLGDLAHRRWMFPFAEHRLLRRLELLKVPADEHPGMA